MTRILESDHGSLATRAVHAGHVADPLSGAVMPPIYQTSTYQQEGIGKNKGYEYGRTQNPTREVLERNVASLEGGTHGFAFGSGLAALDTILKLFKSGDHFVCANNLYGGSPRLMTRVYEPFGLKFTFVDMRDVTNVDRAITPATRLIYTETPDQPDDAHCRPRGARRSRGRARTHSRGRQHVRDAGLPTPDRVRRESRPAFDNEVPERSQ
jgi:cystathionine beta-lyase/cystathionine gamma-synthase